jgi:LemA protein
MELILIAVVVLLPVVFVATTYNTLVALRNHISEAWSNIDTELKRRYELIPNLVATVKGYAKHERETLERVVELRNRCRADHGSVSHQEGTEKQLVGAVQKLLAVAEAYPSNLIAGMFGFKPRDFFNVDPAVRKAPGLKLEI